MNFGEKEDFFERHRYFFDGYCFKFEGLQAEKEKELVNTVKKLSGDISNDAEYILCDSLYFKKQRKNKIPNDYYSIEFIYHCISKNILLNINEYRFRDDKENFEDSIQSVINNKSFEVEELEEISPKSKNKISFLKKEKLNNFINWRKRKPTIKRYEKVTKVIDISSDESIEVPLKINDSSKKIRILDPLSINSKFKERKNLIQSNEEAGPSHQKTRITTKDFDDIEDEVSIILSSQSSLPTPLSPPSTASSSKPLSSDHDSADNDDDNNNDAITISNKNKWWHKLPKQLNPEVYIENRKRSGRGAVFSESEQRIMIAFLIKYKLICRYSPASRVPWELMHTKGYLLHRTVESLSNNYRRSILPNISNYKLPRKYEKIFLLSRR